jgi:hypothetical protein
MQKAEQAHIDELLQQLWWHIRGAVDHSRDR